MLPDRCSVRVNEKDCPNPPLFVVSIKHSSGEYMIFIVCEEHRDLMERRLNTMQNDGDLPKGTIRFVDLKPVGTDCVANYPDKWEI